MTYKIIVCSRCKIPLVVKAEVSTRCPICGKSIYMKNRKVFFRSEDPEIARKVRERMQRLIAENKL